MPAEYTGHYVRTPYAHQPKLGRKYTPPLHVDLGQGLLQLIEEVQHSRSGNSCEIDIWNRSTLKIDK